MNKQLEQVNLKVLELSQENDIYMTLKLLLITSNPNLNKCVFTPDFIHEVVENKDFYIGGVSLVAERNKLEAGKKNLGHGLSKSGELISDVIGSFSDFSESQAEDGSWELLGTAKIFKRYPKVCESLVDLYNLGELTFSCEVLVSAYSKDEDGNKVVDKGNGQFLGQACVSHPAEVKSIAFMMVAEALNIDLGSDNLNKNKTFEELFQNAKLIVETSELDLTQIQRKVYTQFMEIDDWYEYDIIEFSVNYIILLNCEGNLYRIDYSISGDTLTLGEMYKVSKAYTRINNININEEGNAKMEELQKELDLVKAETENLKAEIASKDTVIAEKENIIVEKDTLIASKDADLIKIGEQLEAKSVEVSELQPYKVEADKLKLEKEVAETQEKITAMKARCLKVLSEKEVEEIIASIESLDEVVINKVLAEKYVALASVKPEVKPIVTLASRITDSVNIGNSDPTSLKAKYSI